MPPEVKVETRYACGRLFEKDPSLQSTSKTDIVVADFSHRPLYSACKRGRWPISATTENARKRLAAGDNNNNRQVPRKRKKPPLRWVPQRGGRGGPGENILLDCDVYDETK